MEDTLKDGYCFSKDLAQIKRGTSFLKREYFVGKQNASNQEFVEMITKQSLDSGLIAESNTFGLLKSDSPADDHKRLSDLKNRYMDPKLDALSTLPSPVYGEILFNYFIRDNARHLLNERNLPASDNFYCITPKTKDFRIIHWVVANSRQYVDSLVRASRAQGSGLRKLQMFEYANSQIPDYRKFSALQNRALDDIGRTAISDNWSLNELQDTASNQLAKIGFSSD
jgi:hypothetical protein